MIIGEQRQGFSEIGKKCSELWKIQWSEYRCTERIRAYRDI